MAHLVSVIPSILNLEITMTAVTALQEYMLLFESFCRLLGKSQQQCHFKGKVVTNIMSWHCGTSTADCYSPAPFLGFTLGTSVKLLLTLMKVINACLLKTKVQCICLTRWNDSLRFLGALDETIFIHVKMVGLILHCLPLPELERSFCFAKSFTSTKLLFS